MQWLAELEQLMRADAKWDGCEVIRVPLDGQLGFNVANEVRRIKNNPGPAVFIHKAQRRLYDSLAKKLQRDVKVYSAETASCASDIFDRCQEALDEYEGGEPRIAKRELVAYLIVAKLARGGYWAGGAKNKAYLTAGDLPNGGFPRSVSKGEVSDAADVLFNAGLLNKKLGDGKPKYGLAEKTVVQPILDKKSFDGNQKMDKWFQKGKERVPARELSRNYG
ncbi:MAG: hypothetical protein V3R99_13665 [Thermoguttaceae bacterium]